MTQRPAAILCDVGGVFLLPSHGHIRSALERIDHVVADDDIIDRAHYTAARVFPMDLDPGQWMGPFWTDYLREYARAVGVPEHQTSDAVDHLRNEYVTGALWSHVIPGSKEGLGDLVATGVPIGIVSNSDGTIGARLAEIEILQLGPGPGIEVRCLIDSGSVGVEKPDPRIFDYALEVLDLPPDNIWYIGDTPAFDIVGARRAGLQPFLIDPFEINGDFGVPTVRSLSELAERVAP